MKKPVTKIIFMDSKEVEEMNRVIAEFDGWKEISYLANQHKTASHFKTDDKGFQSVITLDKLKYQSSWDLLMPVVEKISRIPTGWKDADISDTFFLRTFGMLNAETGKPMVRINTNTVFEADTLIEATYQAVHNFILFYNQRTGKEENK